MSDPGAFYLLSNIPILVEALASHLDAKHACTHTHTHVHLFHTCSCLQHAEWGFSQSGVTPLCRPLGYLMSSYPANRDPRRESSIKILQIWTHPIIYNTLPTHFIMNARVNDLICVQILKESTFLPQHNCKLFKSEIPRDNTNKAWRTEVKPTVLPVMLQ